MNKASELIHQPTRLKIMAAMKALPNGEWIDFVRLRDIVNMTDGNFGAHINTLENAGLLIVDKGYVAKRPRTRISLSPAGHIAFDFYLTELQAILSGAAATAPESGFES
ncbi:transcriptional regulator [Duganella sp. HH101]|uniref:transcriptional regulator n=1 Tax=Duganella sp. HH101 TaxID=1781066 RepID=UPI0008744299|nr:transcriptional regulator [Duganella sp. HH101]OEZ97579.1 hypothetical protein DUGA2_59180 [Duganella sp. HH101]